MCTVFALGQDVLLALLLHEKPFLIHHDHAVHRIERPGATMSVAHPAQRPNQPPRFGLLREVRLEEASRSTHPKLLEVPAER